MLRQFRLIWRIDLNNRDLFPVGLHYTLESRGLELVTLATIVPTEGQNTHWRKAVLRQPDTAERVREQGFDIIAGSVESAQSFMASEVERWGKLVREANIKAD